MNDPISDMLIRIKNASRAQKEMVLPAAIAVVHVATDHDDAEIAARLARSASAIRDALEG